MVKKKIFSIFVFAFILSTYQLINLPTVLYATGTSGGEFLKIGVGERAIGMGGAFSSIADNVTAVYWNPAGLSQLKMREFSAMHLEYLVDIKSEYLSYAHPLGRFGTLGSQLALLISHHSRRDDYGNEIGDFYNYEGVFSLAYGRAISKNLSLGLTLKTIYTQLDNDKTSNLAFDFGGLYKTPFEGINLSFVLEKIATGLKVTQDEEPVSPDFKVGVSYNLGRSDKFNHYNGLDKSSRYTSNNLILASDIILFKEGRINPTATSLGGEYSLTPPVLKNTKVALRLGYTGKASSTLGGLTGLTAGLGLEYRKEVITSALDYAFVPFGELGNTHRISLTLKF